MSNARRRTQSETPATETPATETPKAETPETPATGKNGRLRANGAPCLCGCEAATLTGGARFLPGHDAKLRAAVRKAGLVWSAVPVVARPFFLDDAAHGEATAGLLVVDAAAEAPVLRDVKAERRFRSVAAVEGEAAKDAEIAELRRLLEAAKNAA